MYPARQQKNDERRPGDLGAENEKLKAELEELREKSAGKNQMFAELNEINIRLEEKLEGNGKIIVDGLSRMPLFFEGEINKRLVFENSVLETENRNFKQARRKTDKNFEDKITRELEINRELNIRNKILQVENRNLREIFKKPEGKFKGEINKELNAINSTLEVKNKNLEAEIKRLEKEIEGHDDTWRQNEELNRKNISLTCENRRLKADIESPEAEEGGDMGEWLMKAIAVVLVSGLIFGFFYLLVTLWVNSSYQPG